MAKEYLLSVLFVLCLVVGLHARNHIDFDRDCTTFDGRPGECMSSSECSRGGLYFQSMFTDQCRAGWDGAYTGRICCPSRYLYA